MNPTSNHGAGLTVPFEGLRPWLLAGYPPRYLDSTEHKREESETLVWTFHRQ